MRTAVVLHTRDLRVRDQPALREATRRAEEVVPLFVLDDVVLGSRFASPNRVGYLVESLADLRSSLRNAGGDLVVRRGDAVAETARLADQLDASVVLVSRDVTAFARRREERLARALGRRELVACDGVTVVPPDALKTYRVFTPYWRAWKEMPRRRVERAPSRVRLPSGLDPGEIPDVAALAGTARSPEVLPGGERRARRQLDSWTRATLTDYEHAHDDLAGDRTSRLGAALHFGCLSPLEVATRLERRPGGAEFVRQLCWRDFHHQTTWAFPGIATEELRPRGRSWSHDRARLEAWREGRTGIPIVDAGMRQLRREGWMHNRARMLTASFLTKQMGIDWRVGARHFMDWLVDGDVADNFGNWQWVAGTGLDTRPNRVFNPIRQAQRFDPRGAYVRRYVPELADVDGRAVHEPWKQPPETRRTLDYPDPLIDHEAAAAAFRANVG